MGFRVTPVLAAEQLRVFEETTEKALDEVGDKYGSGYPYFKGGRERILSYHNLNHTKAVRRGAAALAGALELSPSERTVADLAAAAHDIVQLKPRGVMEAESAAWLEYELAKSNLFSSRLLKALDVGAVAALAVLGTEPVFTDGGFAQRVDQLSFPSRSAELIARAVACGDMREIHAPTGPLVAHQLWQEMEGLTPDQQPDLTSLVDFQTRQIELASNYRYPHERGEEVFGALRGEVVGYHEQVVGRLEIGDIATFGQLLNEDEAFGFRYLGR